jgi:hypothetical protein
LDYCFAGGNQRGNFVRGYHGCVVGVERSALKNMKMAPSSSYAILANFLLWQEGLINDYGFIVHGRSPCWKFGFFLGEV